MTEERIPAGKKRMMRHIVATGSDGEVERQQHCQPVVHTYHTHTYTHKSIHSGSVALTVDISGDPAIRTGRR